MDVDVIVLCSGDGSYFLETIRAVLKQSLLPKRIYVIDNGCPHSDYERLSKELGSDLISYRKFPDRLRMTANWQRCLGVGDSPFFVCLHDDDIWDGDVLARGVGILSEKERATACLLGHAPFHVGELPEDQATAVAKREKDFEFVDGLREPLRSFVLSTANLGHMCALICRRSALGYPIQNTYMPDQGYLANHAAYGRIELDPHVSVHIRIHPNSVTTSYAGNSRAAVEMVSQVRNILMFQIENRNFSADQLASIAADVPPAYLMRVLQACHSWPLRPALLKFGRGLLDEKPFKNIKSDRIDGKKFLGPWGWIAAAFAADLAYFSKEKSLPN